jgi:hypothetical protein
VCLAGESAGVGNPKELIAGMLLQRVLGTSPLSSFVYHKVARSIPQLGTGAHVKWGHGAGKLQKAVGETSTAAVSAVNFTYSDSGLLGASIVCPAAEAAKASFFVSLSSHFHKI